MTFGILITAGLLLTGMNPEQFSSERQLLIFGTGKNSALVQQQIQLLIKETKEVNERSIVITVIPKDDVRVRKYSINPDQFTVLLIGKDNTEKFRSNCVVPAEQLFGIIDAMPMRKAEIESGIK